MRFGKAVVKSRVIILIVALALLVPSVLGMIFTRVNYDMLSYLPDDLDTVKGQEYLLKDFGKGAFSFIIVDGMEEKDIVELEKKIKKVDHVDTVLWYADVADVSLPMELLPDDVKNAFNAGDETMIAVFFDSSTSSDATMDAIAKIRDITNKQCFVSGMSAMICDLRLLAEREEIIYVAIAVVLAVIVMMLFMDSYIIPFIFLASIGMSILFNMGSNYFLGEISYITKALAAVLQLAVTMDYSIFLWHSYEEEKRHISDHKEAMAKAISETILSVFGSSITTVAGFIALCFMTFTLGRDLGIVMAKGVLLGVFGCVTVLPSIILLFDKPLEKTAHRPLIPDTRKFAKGIVKIFPVFLIIFALVIVPAFMGYQKTNSEVYYNFSESLPDDMANVIANTKLQDDFGVGTTHMLLSDSKLDAKKGYKMVDELKKVKGVKYVLGLKSLIGSTVPEEMIPKELISKLKSDNWELILINSEYKPATDNVEKQIKSINTIIKKYDSKALLIGEASCIQDMIDITDIDFKVVNIISIFAIFIIILIVEKSITLPVILVAVIELAIFINLALSHVLGTHLPFIAPICISTIQLGATVDYAILMTTRYKKERSLGNDKRTSVVTALSTSIPSIVVSALGLFAATFGVAVYSDVDMIGSLCMLLARGAIVSMFCVILVLPAMFMLFDKVIAKTTLGFNKGGKKNG